MTNSSCITLVPNRLFALGDSIPNDGRISWLDGEAGGWEALNAYVLVEDSQAYIIDTQFPLLEATVRDQAIALRDRFGITDVTVLITRVVEFDCTGNAEILTRVLPVRRMYAHYGAEEWIYFRGTAPSRERIEYEPLLLQKNETLAWLAGRPLTTIGAPLRLLACAWVYDHATKTLFTSDGFSHARPSTPEQRVLTAEEDTTDEEEVRDHLLRKFDYLEGADTRPVRAALDAVFSNFQVDRVAPTHGLVLEGAEVVARHVGLVDRVLGDLATTAAPERIVR
jgi:flavorubredoxin